MDNQVKEATEIERFSECLMGMNKWATIDEFVDALDDAGFWDEDFYEHSEEQAKKQFIRRMIRRAKDDTGWPMWANVKIQDPKTEIETHVYKQESLFDLGDYKQVIVYHHQSSAHHSSMELGYRQRAEIKFGKQAFFDF
jgi:hypothetical protein